MTKYNADGTKSQVNSFYDSAQGVASRVKVLAQASEQLSNKNKDYQETPYKLRRRQNQS